MDLWFEKYRPKTMENMVISESKMDFLDTWFNNFKDGTQSGCALLFSGPPGTGKTTCAHAILKKHGYRVKEFNASDIRSKILISENLDGLINIADVNRVTNEDEPTIGIIMDEVDGMFKGDRGGVDELLSFISIPSNRKKKQNKNGNKAIPIICICNLGNVKRDTIKHLQKECQELAFQVPDVSAMLSVVDRVSDGELLDIDEDAKLKIVQYAQGDFRRLIGILEFLYVGYGNTIKSEDVEASYNILCKKEKDLHITDNIKRLLNEKLPAGVIASIYNGDKSKAPMVVHQNYLKAISIQKTTAMNKIANGIKCMDSLVVSDVIEKMMYNTQSWFLQPIQGLACANIPNYYINKYPKVSIAGSYWASILSISSHSQNLKKNIHELMYQVHGKHSYSIADIQLAVEVVFYNLMGGNYDKAIKLIIKYNMCDLSEFDTKKSIGVIDKLAKYIKISPYYTDWSEFKDNNKNNKDFDSSVKKAIIKFNTGGIKMTKGKMTSTKNKIPTKTCPVIKKKPTPGEKTVDEQVALINKRKTVVVKKKIDLS